ncbi:MAG: OmpA family protein [Acidobacteria bacterium]|nr:OmpA family protein [Acidobacteriota bacterium]
MNLLNWTGLLLSACGALTAQSTQSQIENANRMAAGAMPVYRVTTTARTAKAINYQHRNGATKIDFRGTSLLPGSRGEAKVEGKQGYIEIEVEFDDLKPANLLGSEYLTYVMWAITPEGRTSNLGEILLNGTKSKLNVSTELQSFALLVTAEPYYAVTRPSDLIVMENVVRKDTAGRVEEIDAKYELLERGQYLKLSNPLALKLDDKQPLELYEARNAVQIARSMGSDRFAADTFVKAEKSLAQAEAYQARKAGKKPVTMMARESVQIAEDARIIAVKRQEEQALMAERQLAADRQNQAESGRAAAESEANRISREADAARIAAKSEADRLTREKDAQALAAADAAALAKRENSVRLASAELEAERLKMENAARMAAANTEAERLKLENETRLTAAANEADRLKRENETQLDNAAKQRAQMEREKGELRILLLKQFNAILKTEDTARGLIVNMPDVLFDTAQFTLRPIAREKLAKVAGIVSGHPGLKLDIEGHTDSVGSDSYNQTLSEKRGDAVREYLAREGMATSSLTSKGFGESKPAASNDNASGRQQNRRVEIVISGDLIGTQIGKPVSSQ